MAGKQRYTEKLLINPNEGGGLQSTPSPCIMIGSRLACALQSEIKEATRGNATS